MKFFSLCKDGGPESTVWGYFLCEIKPLFSIALLRFENGSRDAYHSHAFNCVSWVLKGKLREYFPIKMGPNTTFTAVGVSPEILNEIMQDPCTGKIYKPSLKPVFTYRDTTHKVVSVGRTWVLTFRGPWAKTWKEILPSGEEKTLTNGRREVY